MAYILDMGAWNTVFAVPAALVDKHLKLAGKEQLQVILWMLRHAGESFSEEEMGAALGISAERAAEALEYWAQEGLLSTAGERISPVPQTSPAAEKPAASAPPAQLVGEKRPAARRRLTKPDAAYLAARMKGSATIRSLLQEAEMTLGILSPAMTAVILAGCDDYGLPAEVLALLLHYAKEVGKTSTAYIDSVVRDWSASGIFTLEAAEEKLQELSERRLAWSTVAAAAGLPKRSPSKKEEESAYRWVSEWRFSREMLAAAYERCVDNTGKFSAAYMNKVLERWYKEGLKTPEDVTAAEERKAQEKNRPKSYNTDDVDNLSFFDLPEDL